MRGSSIILIFGIIYTFVSLIFQLKKKPALAIVWTNSALLMTILYLLFFVSLKIMEVTND